MESARDREREKKRRNGVRGGEGEKEGKRGRIDESRRVWKSMDRWKGGIGGGPTALVAVERTNFVLIEKSPAPNPIYKPANMAGVGRSPARSLAHSLARLTSYYRAFRESRYTTAPGFESAMHHVSWIKGF